MFFLLRRAASSAWPSLMAPQRTYLETLQQQTRELVASVASERPPEPPPAASPPAPARIRNGTVEPAGPAQVGGLHSRPSKCEITTR